MKNWDIEKLMEMLGDDKLRLWGIEEGRECEKKGLKELESDGGPVPTRSSKVSKCK